MFSKRGKIIIAKKVSFFPLILLLYRLLYKYIMNTVNIFSVIQKNKSHRQVSTYVSLRCSSGVLALTRVILGWHTINGTEAGK